MRIVIAGNYRQYQDYLRENNLTKQQARYVDTPDDLRGLHGVVVVRVGEWWLNPCANDDYLKIFERPTGMTDKYNLKRRMPFGMAIDGVDLCRYSNGEIVLSEMKMQEIKRLASVRLMIAHREEFEGYVNEMQEEELNRIKSILQDDDLHHQG